MRQALIERMLYVVLGLVFIAAGFLTVIQLQSNHRLQAQQKILQEQVAGQKEVLKGVQQLIANQGVTTEDINKSISCVLTFFTVPNRTDYYISDLTTCTVTNMTSGKTSTLPVPNATGSVPSTSKNTSQNSTLTQPSTSQPQEPVASGQPPSVTTPPAPVVQQQAPAVQQLLDGMTIPVAHLTCGLLGVLC